MSGPSYGAAGTSNVPLMGEAGNLGYNAGNLTSAFQPNAFLPYFGAPPRDFKPNPYSAYGRENFALPDAYKGSVPYMTQLMIHVIQDEDLWPTKVVLPIRITENEMEVAWDEVIFNNHLLGPVPEEGVSRLVTQQTNERRDHYVRYGIALILEHGFMKTPKGQQSYQMNITQIRNATLETMYFGVLEALLSSKQYSMAWTRKYGTMARSGAALRGYLGDEVERYMIVQKTEHGFDLMDTKAKKYLRSVGVTPDTWILPEGTTTYLNTVRPENRDYLLAGPGGPAAYKAALAGGIQQQVGGNSCTVYESKTFEVPGNSGGPIDPLVRHVAVGEYNTMIDTVTDYVPCEEYKTFMRDIFIYNEARDDFSRVTIKNALKACCRFDGDRLAFPDNLDDTAARIDPFIYVDKYGAFKPVYVFGDMTEANMSTETIRKVAYSIVCKRKAKRAHEHGRFGAPVEADSTRAEEDKIDYGKFPETEEFEQFFKFVHDIMPESRVFQEGYAPTTRVNAASSKTDLAKSGFYWNTMATHVPKNDKADMNFSEIENDQVESNLNALFLPASLYNENGFKWEVLRSKLLDLVSSSESPSVDEMSYNTALVDEMVAKFRICEEKLVVVAKAVLVLVRTLDAFKKKAWSQTNPKVFTFVAHKLLQHIVAAPFGTGFKNALMKFVKYVQGTADDDLKKLEGNVNHVSIVFGDEASTDKGREKKKKRSAEDQEKLRPFGPYDHAMMKQEKPVKRVRGNDRFGAFGAVGGDIGEAADDGALEATSHPDYTSVMEERYADVKDGTDADDIKSVMLTFMQLPVTYTALAKLLDHDIYFPFEFLLFRPRITHAMATGILLKSGTETGETLIGHADFQLADDVVRKMHYGNFTLYSKSIVYKSDNVYLAENIVSTGYIRGNDVSMNTFETLKDDNAGGAKSIYVALVPVSGAQGDDDAPGYFNPLDVTGAFATNVPHLQNLDNEVGNTNMKKHYPGAAYYAAMWGMNNSAQRMQTEYISSQMNEHNTLCFQGHQTTYNHHSHKFDLTTVNTGHFGDRIYPGCGRVRRMAGQKYLEPVSYTNSFGATKNLTSIGV